MPYLTNSQIKIGKLVLFLHPKTLKETVAIIVKREPWDGFVEVRLPSGEQQSVNSLYLREVEP